MVERVEEYPFSRIIENDSRIIKCYYLGVEWMTIKETAKYLRISVSTILKFVKIEKLPNNRQGYIIRLKQSDIEAFLILNKIKPKKPTIELKLTNN